MSQNKENTWSATDAKENQQEIARLVSAKMAFFFYPLSFCVKSSIIWYRPLFEIRWINPCICFKVNSLSLIKDGDAKSEDDGLDVAKYV